MVFNELVVAGSYTLSLQSLERLKECLKFVDEFEWGRHIAIVNRKTSDISILGCHFY